MRQRAGPTCSKRLNAAAAAPPGPLPFEVGWRIRLVAMPNDADPLPAGSEGVVETCTWVAAGGWWQVGVAWDAGRSLMLSVPPDVACRVG
jgi:hypothetical protein